MAKNNKYQLGQRVMTSRKDKVPSERSYIIVGHENKSMRGKVEHVYHLARYDFDQLAFNTTSHVPEKLLKPVS